MITKILVGDCRDGRRYAAIDPDIRNTSGQLCQFQFSATLAPYGTEGAARKAFAAAGASDIREQAKR